MTKAIVVYRQSKGKERVPRMVLIADGESFRAIGDPETQMGRMARSMQARIGRLSGKEREDEIRQIFDNYRQSQDGYASRNAIYDYTGDDKKEVDDMYDTLAAKSYKSAGD